MNLNISVTYFATDGRMPENVSIEMVDVTGYEAMQMLAPALESLIMAPAARLYSVDPDPDDPSDHLCRRLMCLHSISRHARETRVPIEGPIQCRWGACETCKSKEKCDSFVGPGEGWSEK